MHFEVDRETDESVVAELRADLLRVLADVRAAVADWGAMRERASTIAVALSDPADAETAELLRWMVDDHFTFLGYRDTSRPGSELGILRNKAAPPGSGQHAGLTVRKADVKATVHRPVHMEQVCVGSDQFLGLWTSAAYNTSPLEIPLLRRKVAAVLDRSGFGPASHARKNLVSILETFPRDELFQIDEDELYTTAKGILSLQERRRVRLFVRKDDLDRFFSCLVYLPRDRFTTELARRIESILLDALEGSSVESTGRVSESVLARLHVIVTLPSGAVPVTPDIPAIEARLADAARSWTDDLADELFEHNGEERGIDLLRRYGDAFPAAYRGGCRSARRRRRHPPNGGPGRKRDHERPLVGRGAASDAPRGVVRMKLFRVGEPMALSDVLPLLEHMGVRVVDERPYEVHPASGPPLWIYDIGLTSPDLDSLDNDIDRTAFCEAFGRLWRGEAESDGFNRLVLRAGLTSRERRDPPGVREVPAPDRLDVQSGLHRRHPRGKPGHRSDPGRALRSAVRPRRARRFRGSTGGAGSESRRGADRCREPRRGPHPVVVPAPHPGDAAHQLPSARSRGAAEALHVVQARPRAGSRPPAAPPAGRGVGVLAAVGGRAPARRPHRTRRHPMVGSARGLPHRDPRPHEGTDGEERGDRARGREGWLRREAAADHERSRCAAGRGRGLLPDPDQRTARHHRQHRRRHGRPTDSRRPLRRGRSLPRRRCGQGDGHLLRPRELDLLRVRLLAGGRVRLGWLCGLRPQGDGHHGPRGVGVGAPSLPRARHQPRQGSVHGHRDRRHVRATCSATGCCSRRRSSSSAHSTTATSSSTRSPIRPRRSPSAAGCSTSRAPRGTTTTARSSRRAEGCGRAPRSRSRCPTKPARCSAPRRPRSHRPRSSPLSCGPRQTFCSTAGSAPMSRRPPSRTARSATARTTRCESTVSTSAAVPSSRAGTSASRNAAASSTRSRAGS